MSDDDIRARHVPTRDHYIDDPDRQVCDEDYQDWPCDTARVLAALDEHDRIHQMDTDALRARADKAEAELEEARTRLTVTVAAFEPALHAARALADELGRMLSEACWAIDHTCTQCGEREPAHTPRCPTANALAKWETSHVK